MRCAGVLALGADVLVVHRPRALLLLRAADARWACVDVGLPGPPRLCAPAQAAAIARALAAAALPLLEGAAGGRAEERGGVVAADGLCPLACTSLAGALLGYPVVHCFRLHLARAHGVRCADDGELAAAGHEDEVEPAASSRLLAGAACAVAAERGNSLARVPLAVFECHSVPVATRRAARPWRGGGAGGRCSGGAAVAPAPHVLLSFSVPAELLRSRGGVCACGRRSGGGRRSSSSSNDGDGSDAADGGESAEEQECGDDEEEPALVEGGREPTRGAGRRCDACTAAAALRCRVAEWRRLVAGAAAGASNGASVADDSRRRGSEAERKEPWPWRLHTRCRTVVLDTVAL